MEYRGIQHDIELGIFEMDDVADGNVALHEVLVEPADFRVAQAEVGDGALNRVGLQLEDLAHAPDGGRETGDVVHG